MFQACDKNSTTEALRMTATANGTQPMMLNMYYL